MMRPGVAVALAFAVLIGAGPKKGGRMQVETQGVEADGIEFVSVEHFPEYAIGLPVWVALTVRADEDTSFHRLAFADLLNLQSSIGLEMIGPSFTHRKMPTPVVEEEFGRTPQSLMPGETRRMLADISPLVGPDVPEGEYRIRLTYLSEEFSLKGKPFAVRFRRPDAAEQLLLAFAAGRPKQSDWAEWMRRCQERSLALTQIPRSSPAALTFVLNSLFCGREGLASITPNALEEIEAIPAPERKALQAELLLARGDTARAVSLQGSILRETPGLQWWMAKLQKGTGYLKTFSKRPQ